MHLGELKLGKSIEIYVTRDRYKLRLVSKIEDVAYDHIAVSLITGNGRVFQFQEKDHIEFIYKDEQRLWKWSGMTGTIEKLDDTFVHCFYGPADGESYNRRNAYRVYIGEETRFHWIKNGSIQVLQDNIEDMSEVEEPGLTKNASGHLKDISETGAGIYCNEDIKLHDAVSFKLITRVGIIKCIGEVVRITNETNGIYRRFIGINFVEVSSVISKYVFLVQRLQLKKSKK